MFLTEMHHLALILTRMMRFFLNDDNNNSNVSTINLKIRIVLFPIKFNINSEGPLYTFHLL